MMRFRKILGNQCGFTLMELIISLVLITFVLGGITTCGAVFGDREYKAEAIQKLDDGTVYRPLVKLPDEGKIGGVCAGMAYKWGVDPWIPRAAFIVGTFVIGGGILTYIVLALFLDNAHTPNDYATRIAGS